MRRFELTEGTSDKFWEIDPTGDGLGYIVRFGRRGTNGQTQEKTFETAAKATAEIDKLICEKAKKGYGEVAQGAAVKPPPQPAPVPALALSNDDAGTREPTTEAPLPAAALPPPPPLPAPPALPATGVPTASPATATAAAAGPPDEDRVFWDGSLAKRAWAVRSHPLASGQSALSLQSAAAALRDHWSARQHADQVRRYLEAPEVDIADAIAMASVTGGMSLDLDAQRQGVHFAMRVVSRCGIGVGPLERLRTRIAGLADAEYAAAAAEASRLAPSAARDGLSGLVFLFPTEPGAVATADTHSTAHLLPMRSALPAATLLPGYQLFFSYSSSGDVAASLVHRFGLAALPLLLGANIHGNDEERNRASLFARLGHDDAFAVLVAGIGDRSVAPALRDACELQPARALRLLSAVRGPRRRARRAAPARRGQRPSRPRRCGRSDPAGRPAASDRRGPRRQRSRHRSRKRAAARVAPAPVEGQEGRDPTLRGQRRGTRSRPRAGVAAGRAAAGGDHCDPRRVPTAAVAPYPDRDGRRAAGPVARRPGADEPLGDGRAAHGAVGGGAPAPRGAGPPDGCPGSRVDSRRVHLTRQDAARSTGAARRGSGGVHGRTQRLRRPQPAPAAVG